MSEHDPAFREKLKRLHEQRWAEFDKAEKLINGKPEPSSVDAALAEGHIQHVRSLDAQINDLEKQLGEPSTMAERHEQKQQFRGFLEAASRNRPQVRHISDTTRGFNSMNATNKNSTILRSWLRAGSELETADDVRSLSGSGATSQTLNIRSGLVSKAPTGSYAVGESFLPGFEKLLTEYASYLGFARYIRTKSGEPLRIAVDADQRSANKAGRWIGETVTDDDKSITLEQRTLYSHTVSSNICLVSYELLEDAEAPIEQIVNEALAARVGRTISEALTNGAGPGTPNGWATFVGDNTKGSQEIPTVTTTASGAISYDDIVNAFGALPPYALSSKSCRWLCNNSTYAALLKLKDSTQRPLLQPNGEVKDSPAGSLLGIPLVLVPEMDDIAASNFPLIIGDWNQFAIRQVGDILLQKSSERFFESRQVAYRALLRVDATILDGNSFRALAVKS